ncbi:MAG: imidazole glycerol phosphate synthase subunit HisH [Dehalococcoidales bacterium]|nr:imidazole glycerol phosphate synthase subunit HisH [Dehalococcoidales bacterium]
MIAIIDYGASNLRSVVNAVTSLGYQPKVTSNPGDVVRADGVILPGVGAAAGAIRNLERLGLAEAIQKHIAQDRPLLGICLGLQILLSATEEGGGCECLDIIPGRVRRLPSGLKTPHMGWNQVKQLTSHPIFDGIPDEANFYFVHSYYAEPDDKSLIIGETEYGRSICSVIVRGNLIATQFHPEKSGELGLRLYANFLRRVPGQIVCKKNRQE